MKKFKKINLNILALPLLNIMFFITISSFGQTFLMKTGLSFTMALVFGMIYIVNFKQVPQSVNIHFIVLLIFTVIMNFISGEWYYWTISLGTVSSIALMLRIQLKQAQWKISFVITSAFSTTVLILYNMDIALTNWNPNSIALFCLLGMLPILISFKLEGNRLKKILTLLIIIFEFFMVYKTESRTSVLIFATCIITIVLFNKLLLNKRLLKMYTMICLLLTVIAVQYSVVLKMEFMEPILKFSKETFGKATLFSDREYIWDICQRYVGNDWLIGTGKSLYNFIYSHNMFYSIEYTYGVIGFILYTLLIYRVVIHVRNNNNNTISNSLCLIFLAVMLGQVTENFMFTSNTNIFLPYLYLSIAMGVLKNNRIEESL